MNLTPLRRGAIIALLVSLGSTAHALTFNLTFDASTVTAPAGFFTAFNYATQYYQNSYSDPIVINLHVGWGDINGGAISPGNLGQSQTFQQAYSYATLKTALIADAKTADDATAIASLPASDPTPSVNFAMSNAEAKALGLLAGNAAGIDGYVGFNKTATYTFDPNNRAVAGATDFIGLADHEITEIMGRYGFGQNGGGGRDSPIDLFRYFAPGTRDLAPVHLGAANYFSIDGGVTAINSFNIAASGDVSDWAGLTPDAYNAFVASGRVNPDTVADVRLMDVLGYDRVTVPDFASTLTLFGLGLVVLGGIHRRVRTCA